MGSKFIQKNTCESGFDSFEFDDGFFTKVDSELKKNDISKKQFELANKYHLKGGDKPYCAMKRSGKKVNYYDLPLFIEDLNESEFFDTSKRKDNNISSKVDNAFKGEKAITSYNGFINCLSPIQGPKLSNKINLSSSTPVKPNDNLNCKEKFANNSQKMEENSAKTSDISFLEADLFDDWNPPELNKKDMETQKNTVTFSQALKLIEEAELARDSDKECLNNSIDLLTGEIVGADLKNMFEESFDLPKSTEKTSHRESSSDSVVVVKNFKTESKPSAAQKLNFESKEVNSGSIVLHNENTLRNTCFDSDDDFDFLTQDLLKKPKQVFKRTKSNTNAYNNQKADKVTPLKNYHLNESTDDIVDLKKKKGKCFNIIDSDSTEDSPRPKYHRKNKIMKRKNFQENVGREFIDYEAEVSDEVVVSSDEAEEEGEFEKSFLDEKSYFTQNCSANMTAKYLESVKTVKRFGSFKIPAMKPYDPQNVFSQIPEENNTDYEIDSFCVNEVEEETKTDLSDLEVAEKILEINRKKRKKKKKAKI